MHTCRPTESQQDNAAAIRDIKHFLRSLHNQVIANLYMAASGGTCDDAVARSNIKNDLDEKNPKVSAVTFPLQALVEFNVKHYAKTVLYKMEGFCAKSKDQLDSFVVETLRKKAGFMQVRFVWAVFCSAHFLSAFSVLLWPAM